MVALCCIMKGHECDPMMGGKLWALCEVKFFLEVKSELSECSMLKIAFLVLET